MAPLPRKHEDAFDLLGDLVTGLACGRLLEEE
jgi:hypothetical protein